MKSSSQSRGSGRFNSYICSCCQKRSLLLLFFLAHLNLLEKGSRSKVFVLLCCLAFDLCFLLIMVRLEYKIVILIHTSSGQFFKYVSRSCISSSLYSILPCFVCPWVISSIILEVYDLSMLNLHDTFFIVSYSSIGMCLCLIIITTYLAIKWQPRPLHFLGINKGKCYGCNAKHPNADVYSPGQADACFPFGGSNTVREDTDEDVSMMVNFMLSLFSN